MTVTGCVVLCITLWLLHAMSVFACLFEGVLYLNVVTTLCSKTVSRLRNAEAAVRPASLLAPSGKDPGRFLIQEIHVFLVMTYPKYFL